MTTYIDVGFPNEKKFRNAVESGKWDMLSNEEAKDEISYAEGDVCPIVFWIKDSRGKIVLKTPFEEEDCLPGYEDDDWEEDEEEEEEPWTDSDFEIKKGVLLKYRGKGGKVVIPSSVTRIGHDAFYKCSGLTSVTIPDSVTIIDELAFYHCEGLTSVTIGNSVTSIGKGAFNFCINLTSVTIPNSVTNIGYLAFAGCEGLTSITIPDSVTIIDYSAFKGCDNLANVKILNPKLFEEVVNDPDKSFDGTPWADKVKSGLVKENKRRRVRESQKITLTFGQLKRLIRESTRRSR